jgi:biopolymer transport protein TolR
MSFGRLEKPGGNQPISDINVTPLVDVMLVLLVIFIITAPLMSSRMELELPKADERVTKAEEPAAFVSISVDATGQVFWDEQPVDAAQLAAAARSGGQARPGNRAAAAGRHGRALRAHGATDRDGSGRGPFRIGFVADPTTGAPTAPGPGR